MAHHSTPLSAYLDGPSVPAKTKKTVKNSRKIWIGALLLAFLPSLSTTFASSIAINNNAAIEFGQGSQATTVCDNSITVQIGTTYDNASSSFRATSITLGDLDTAACLNKTLTVKALDIAGNPLDLTGDGSALTYQPTSDQGVQQVPLTITGTVNSVDIARVTVETA
jgi:hypothetical protein